MANSPASIRRARSTSCAAVSSGTFPISFRYIRTGSFVGALRRSSSICRCAIGVELVAGDLDDLDPLAAQVLLDLRQELLDLLGREVVDRNRFEQVLGGDETALATASGDRFLRLFQSEVAGHFRHDETPCRGCGVAEVYEPGTALPTRVKPGTCPRSRRRRSSPSIAISCWNRSS